MCFYHDGGYSTIWRESEPKARKQHKCYECGGAIFPGEKYRLIFSVYDGRADTYKICPRCNRLLDAIKEVELAAGCHANESQPSIGGMHEEIEDSDDGWQHYADEYSRLRPGEYLRWPFDLQNHLDQLADDYDGFWCDKNGHAPDDFVEIGGEA